MRSLVVIASLVAAPLVALPVQAQESAPPPPVDRPAQDDTPVQPPEVDDTEEPFEPLPPPIEPRAVDDDDDEDDEDEDDDDEEDEDEDEEPAPRPRVDIPRKLPIPDPRDGGVGGGTFWGSLTGCALGGCAPGIGTAVGAGSLIAYLGAPLTAGCASAGVLIGAPAAIVLGPCASGTALAGGLVGASFDDRDTIPVLIGGLPGVAVGVLGTAGTIWGLIELGSASGGAASDDTLLATTILGISAAASVAAGPLTITGMTIADSFAPPLDNDVRDVDAQRPTPAPPEPGTGAVMTTSIKSSMSY